MSVKNTLLKWPMTPENIDFTGYLSRWKLAGLLILWTCGFASVVFSTVDDHTYYRWMFQPWAFPLRVLLAIGALGFLLATLRLMVKSFTSTPAIRVHNGIVSICAWKKATFPISSITAITTISNGYCIRVGNKKYGVVPALSRDGDLLSENMETLIDSIPKVTDAQRL